MESLLHIQPITRDIDRPLSVGHSHYIMVGELGFEDQDEPTGEHSVEHQIGAPLYSLDHGRHRVHVPLFKSFECMPDRGRPGKQVYLETIHYLKDSKHLIPLRTKIQSGQSQGLRLSHLPSLDFVRRDMCGSGFGITDHRTTIMQSMFERDFQLQRHQSHPIVNWVHDELIPYLDGSNVVVSDFDSRNVQDQMEKLRHAVLASPYDINSQHVTSLHRIMGLEHESYPISYYSRDVVSHRIDDLTHLCVHHGLDLNSHGKLKIHEMANVEYNPVAFQGICSIIDQIPLTDFNIDLIIEVDGEISFYHEHHAVHRLARLEDHDIGAYSSEALLSSLVNEYCLRSIRRLFAKHHCLMTDRAAAIVENYAVKMKIVKTIEDEACILLYENNSSSTAEPLCGVYFDIALQSLAPVSTSPGFIDI